MGKMKIVCLLKKKVHTLIHTKHRLNINSITKDYTATYQIDFLNSVYPDQTAPICYHPVAYYLLAVSFKFRKAFSESFFLCFVNI